MSLIKCPECGKEVSDKASACINCGCPLQAQQKVDTVYNSPKVEEKIMDGKMLRKTTHRKVFLFVIAIIVISAFFIILISSVFLASCTSNSNIIGTWTVEKYICGGESIATDEIADWFGEYFAQNNDIKLVFQKSMHVKNYIPNVFDGTVFDETANYTVTDNLIEIYDDDYDSDSEYLTIADGKILMKLDFNTYAVLSK